MPATAFKPVRNNAQSTLAAPLAVGATGLSVQPGDGTEFPAPASEGSFWATVHKGDPDALREVVLVTARSTDSFTITKAQQGTADQEWLAGDTIELLWTAGHVDALVAAIQAIETGSKRLDAVDAAGDIETLARVIATHVSNALSYSVLSDGRLQLRTYEPQVRLEDITPGSPNCHLLNNGGRLLILFDTNDDGVTDVAPAQVFPTKISLAVLLETTGDVDAAGNVYAGGRVEAPQFRIDATHYLSLVGAELQWRTPQLTMHDGATVYATLQPGGASFQGLTVVNAANLNGAINGSRVLVQATVPGSQVVPAGGWLYFTAGGVTMSTTKGWTAPRAGSLAGLSLRHDVTATGSTIFSLQVLKNGVNVWSIYPAGTVANDHERTETQVRDAVAFAAGDTISLRFYSDTTNLTVRDAVALLDLYLDT